MTEKEILNYIEETVKNHPLTYTMILFSKKNREISDYIYEKTKKFNIYDKFTKRSRVYCVLKGITEFPKCKMCSKTIIRNIKDSDKGNEFALYCSPKCENKDPEVIKKLNETNMKKYGCAWSFQSENNRRKSLETMNRKYGVDYAQQNREIKEKSYETMEKRYGNKFPSCVEEIREKSTRKSRMGDYTRFLSSDFIYPLFSVEEYMEYGNYKPYKWRCLKCGTEFESFVDMSWFKQGQNRSYARCEKCYPRNFSTSSGEQDLVMFLESVYKGKIELHKRCLGDSTNKMEVDVLLTDLNIGFEFDGMYWHSEKNGKPKDYHLYKTKMAERIGMRLIHVFEYEWMNKREIVKGRIRNMLGIYDRKIFARKCEVVELSKGETDDFMNRTHLQGECASSVNLALKYDGRIVSAMTFGKSRFNKKYEWELLRFSNELGCHVIGGAGKLLKHFERNYSPKSIISYADRRWSCGDLYFKLGFVHLGDSKPNYWYFKGKKMYSRLRFQKHRLPKMLENFDPSRTEVQNMHDNGYFRIFDCGNMVFGKTV